MNNKRYSESDIKFIEENYGILTIKEIAERLDRTEDGIAYKAVKLGLTTEKPKEYSEEEITYIRDNISKKTISQIAKDIGRTPSALAKYISKYKVNNVRKKKKIYLDNIDKDIVPFFSKGSSYYEIIQNMKVGDSFSLPYSERFILFNKKYEYINYCKENNKKIPNFLFRKTDVEDGIQMARFWRLM